MSRSQISSLISGTVKADSFFQDDGLSTEKKANFQTKSLKTKRKKVDKDLELYYAYKNGSRTSYEALVAKLKNSVCKPLAFQRMHKSGDLTVDDLLQEGCLGVMKSIEKFDPSKKVMLKTYAYIWARAFMRKAIIEKTGNVCIKLDAYNKQRQISKISDLMLTNGGDINWEAVQELAKVNDKQMKEIQESYLTYVYLDASEPENQKGSGDPLLSYFMNEQEIEGEQSTVSERNDRNKKLFEVMNQRLEARELKVILLRFGLVLDS